MKIKILKREIMIQDFKTEEIENGTIKKEIFNTINNWIEKIV